MKFDWKIIAFTASIVVLSGVLIFSFFVSGQDTINLENENDLITYVELLLWKR